MTFLSGAQCVHALVETVQMQQQLNIRQLVSAKFTKVVYVSLLLCSDPELYLVFQHTRSQGLQCKYALHGLGFVHPPCYGALFLLTSCYWRCTQQWLLSQVSLLNLKRVWPGLEMQLQCHCCLSNRERTWCKELLLCFTQITHQKSFHSDSVFFRVNVRLWHTFNLFEWNSLHSPVTLYERFHLLNSIVRQFFLFIKEYSTSYTRTTNNDAQFNPIYT